MKPTEDVSLTVIFLAFAACGKNGRGKEMSKSKEDKVLIDATLGAKEIALKAPFPPNRIKWRASNFRGGKSTALLYIDARDVMERLDEVVGINNWMTEDKNL